MRAERTLRRRVEAARQRWTSGVLSTKDKMKMELEMLEPDDEVYRTSFSDLEEFPAEEEDEGILQEAALNLRQDRDDEVTDLYKDTVRDLKNALRELKLMKSALQ